MFSLSWFTTVPGILITVGVILLLVALVIFIITTLKDKKREKSAPVEKEKTDPAKVETTEIPVQPTQIASVEVPGTNVYSEVPGSVSETSVPNVETATSTPVVTASVPVQNVTEEVTPIPVTDVPAAPYTATATTPVEAVPVEMTTPVENVYTASNNTVPTEPAIQDASVAPTQVEQVQPEPEMPTMPVESTIPTVSETASPIPSVEQVVPEMQDVSAPTISTNDVASAVPEVQPATSEVPVTPVVEPAIEPQTPTVEQPAPVSTPAVEAPAEPQIYGGANPAVTEIPAAQPVQHEIYGGANPLESTQNIPISEIATGQVPNVTPADVNSNVSAVNVTPEQTLEVPSVETQTVQQPVAPTVQTPTEPVVNQTANSNPNGLTSIDSITMPNINQQ